MRRVWGGNKNEGRFSCDPRLLSIRVYERYSVVSLLRFVAQTRGIEEILVRVLVTSHESSTDNDSVNGERERVQSCRSNRRQTRRWNRGCRRMREGEEEGERWERESLGERLLSLTRGEGKMTGRMLINQPRVLFGLWHEGLFLFPSPPSLSSKDVYAARGCFNRVEETNRVTQLTLSSVTSTLCFRASPPSFLHPPPLSVCLRFSVL